MLVSYTRMFATIYRLTGTLQPLRVRMTKVSPAHLVIKHFARPTFAFV